MIDPLNEFLAQLVPPPYDRAAASRRRDQTDHVLVGGVCHVLESGSHGTGIAAKLSDPEGLVGRIPACASDERRRQALEPMRNVGDHLGTGPTKPVGAMTRTTTWSNTYDGLGGDFPWRGL